MSEQTAENDAPKCQAQTGRYVNGVMTASWCDKPATMVTRALDGSRNRFCDEDGAKAVEAGATRITPPAKPHP